MIQYLAAAVAGLALSTSASSPALAQEYRGAVTCDELNWSAEVLESNPDIALACRGVYERDNILYAKATIEVVRVRGNTLTFRTIHTDGSKGDPRSLTLESSWRVELDGIQYRAAELVRGQQLNVYLPEDRFALVVETSAAADSESTAPTEEAPGD